MTEMYAILESTSFGGSIIHTDDDGDWFDTEALAEQYADDENLPNVALVKFVRFL